MKPTGSPAPANAIEDLYLPASLCRHELLQPCTHDGSTIDIGSRLFQVLPREIRREILVFAFGNRTMHMDLSFVHPERDWNPKDLPMTTHAGINAAVVKASSRAPPVVRRDTDAPKSWQWWGSVCHRKQPDHLRTNLGRLQGEREPGSDFCRFGAPHHCKDWPGEYPLKCRIGAMGWLLTCRQA